MEDEIDKKLISGPIVDGAHQHLVTGDEQDTGILASLDKLEKAIRKFKEVHDVRVVSQYLSGRP